MRWLKILLAASSAAVLIGFGCSGVKVDESPIVDKDADVEAAIDEAAAPSKRDAALGPLPYPLDQKCGGDAGVDGSIDDAGLDAADADDDADAGLADAGIDTGPPDSGVDLCDRCSQEVCCNTRASLFDTEEPSELVECMDTCGNKKGAKAPCQAACFDKVPAQSQLFRDHSACLKNRCPACGTSDDRCFKCYQERCRREDLACDLDRDCFLVSACAEDCDYTEACMKSCEDRYPGSKPFQRAIDACVSEMCDAECSQ